jgi:ABC-2 type transport system permease protein
MTPTDVQLVRIVAAREINTRLRDRTFLISTAVMLAIVAGSVLAPLLLSRNGDRPEFTLAVVGQQAQATGETAKRAGAQAIRLDEQRKQAEDGEDRVAGRLGDTPVPNAVLTVRSVPDVEQARRLVKDQSADAALVPGDNDRLVLVANSKVDGDLARLVALANADRELTASGVPADRVNPQPPAQQFLDPAPPNADVVMFLGLAFAALFFLTSFAFGMLIAQSVVEEKQSRIVEILVAAIPVRVLLAGKVLGNTALALGQVVALLAVGLAAAAIAGQSAVTTLLLHSGGWFLLFFALGFTMLACLWAAAGALSTRQEDLQATTTPIQALLFAPFFASVYITEPGRWLTVLSYVPFTAPLTMPRRLLLGDAAWWEAIVAAGLIAVTATIFVLLATRLYEGGLLRTGTRTSLRSAWTGERNVTPVG